MQKYSITGRGRWRNMVKIAVTCPGVARLVRHSLTCLENLVERRLKPRTAIMNVIIALAMIKLFIAYVAESVHPRTVRWVPWPQD